MPKSVSKIASIKFSVSYMGFKIDAVYLLPLEAAQKETYRYMSCYASI
jgi:hypothetical protein